MCFVKRTEDFFFNNKKLTKKIRQNADGKLLSVIESLK